MSDKNWTLKARDWFDPEQDADGFASVSITRDDHWFSGGITIHDDSRSQYIDLTEFSHNMPEHREMVLRVNRNKIAVIRRMLDVAEEALNRYGAEGTS